MSKDLIEHKNTIFNRIRKFIFRLFKKRKNALQDEAQLEKYEQEKRKILELYQKVKNGEIDIYSISEDEIVKINELLKTEIDIENARIEAIKTEVRKIQDETKAIEYETKATEQKTEKYRRMIDENSKKSE